MPTRTWARWAFDRCFASQSPNRRRAVPLRLGTLEERLVPATFRWVNPAGGDVATEANWEDQAGQPGLPGADDDALILVPAITVTSAGTTSLRNLTSIANLDVTAGSLTVAAAKLTGATTVTGGSLNFNGFSSVADLTLPSGTLGGSGVLNVTGSMAWTGGTVAVDLDIAAAATLDIGGAGTDILDGARLTNHGTTTWDGTGTLHFQNGAAFWNTGTFMDAADHVATATGSAVFHNRGLYAKSAGAGVSDIGLVMDNPGTLRAEVGTLQLGGGTTQFSANKLLGGSWYISAGATLDLPALAVTTSAADITLDGPGATFTAISGLRTNEGSLILTNGANLATGQMLTNKGQLTLGVGSTLNVSALQANFTGGMHFQVGGSPASGQYGRIVSSSNVFLANSAIELMLLPGVTTVAADVYPLISGTFVTGILHPATESGAGLTPVFNVAIGATAVKATAIANVTDLGVTAVTPPAGSAAPGDPVSISWVVTNNAAVATTATNWTDGVYISQSPTFDASAVLVAQVPHSGALAGGAMYNGTLTGPLPGTVTGAYYVLVRADDGQAVPDTDRPNNVGVSATTFTMTDPAVLTLGAAPVNGTVAANGDAWYRLDAPGGTPLRVTATFAVAGAGQVSIDYRTYPQPGSALDRAADPTTLLQTVGLAATQRGTYYVRVHGTSGGAFTIHADTPAFAITRLGNTAGSSAGSATLTVHGVGFTPSTTVKLIKGKTTRAATTVQFIDSTTVYVTFKLKGLAAGTYDVVAMDGVQSITAVGGYTVTTVAAGHLEYHFNLPAVTPPVGQDAIVTIDFTNTGGTDLPTPVLQLFDLNGALVRLPEDSAPTPGSDSGGVLWFLPTPTDAPAGVIPAGYHGSIPIVVRAPVDGSPFNLTLYEAVGGTPMNWDIYFKNGLRPRGLSAERWDAVFANFKAVAGATATTYLTAIRNIATYLAAVGSPIRNADVLLGYMVQQADRSIPGNTLFQATDASFPSPGLSLDFTRSFPTSVGGQYRLGRLGRGWVDNWDITLTSESGSTPPTDGTSVFLHIGGAAREFAPTNASTTIYIPVLGGEEDVLTFDGTRFVLTEHEGAVTAFRTDGQLDNLQDPGGTGVTAAYDGNNHLIALNHSDGRALTFTWNAAGQLATVTDPADRVTTLAYKGQQLISATALLGVEKYTYTKNALASVTAPGGVQTTFTYDKLHRLTGQKFGKTEAIKYAYGIGGSVTSTNAAGTTVTVLANADGLIAAVRGGSGPDHRMTYDGDGLSTRIESSDGQVWTTTRDADGHPIAVTDPLGNVVKRSFDGDDLTGVTDARGNTTSFQVDSAGNAVAINYPGGGTKSFVFDSAGDLVQSINRRGNAIQYLTNADGQVSRRLFANGSHTDYTYDSHGNLTAATNIAGTTTLSYLPNDLLQKITYPDGNFLQFTYDAAGRRATSVDQDEFKTGYLYDKVGRLSGLVDGAGVALVKYAYDKSGRMSLKTSANGTFTTYTYDAAGRLLSLVNHKDKKTVNTQFDYTYDAAGRVATMTTGGITTTYGYDPTGQLASVATPTRAITYTYDAAGNRTVVADSQAGTTTFTFDNLNEVTAAGTTTYGYDADGNRTSMTDGSGTTTYSWDDLNQLTSVTSPTDTFAYTRDGLDQLFKTTHNALTTTNLNDPFGMGTVAAQYDTGGLMAHYVNGLGLETRVAADGTKAFYDFDGIGNVAGLTNATGTYVNRYSYLPFGETTTTATGLINPFTYVGQWGVSTDGNGLFNMRARSFDSATGGFVSDDPLGFGGGDVNIRRYSGNDPVNLLDPTGLSCDELKQLQKQLDQAADSYHKAIVDYDMAERFDRSELWKVMLLAGDPVEFSGQASRFEDTEDVKAKYKTEKEAFEKAKEALEDCKKIQIEKRPTPQYVATTIGGKAGPGGGLKTKPAPT
jgi:RHS repeat-associated protein